MTTRLPIARSTVTEICSHRDAALANYDRYFDALDAAAEFLTEAKRHVALATPGTRHPHVDPHNAPEVVAFRQATEAPNVGRLRRVARRLVDLQVWHSVIERTDLEMLMDKQAKEEMRQRIAYVPERVRPSDSALINGDEIDRAIPPVTEDNVLATLETFAEQMGEIWRRGIANAFSALDNRFRSHDGFKVGDRVILTYVFDHHGFWSRSRHEDTLIDIERVFYVLDGREPPRTRDEGIVGTIRRERAGGGLQPLASEHESDYFRVRAFKNGNVHLWFTRDDLVDRVNALLAEYYGAALGSGRDPGGEGRR